MQFFENRSVNLCEVWNFLQSQLSSVQIGLPLKQAKVINLSRDFDEDVVTTVARFKPTTTTERSCRTAVFKHDFDNQLELTETQ